MKKNRTQKGITLIALVITIIVMLLLVGVTINMALNGGLFGYAKKATRDTEKQKQAEQDLASGEVTVNGKDYASIDDYLNNKSQLPKYSEELLDKTTGVLKENARYISDGKTAIIPKGFKVSEATKEQTIDNGLVIKDKDDNEYVWIPVEKAIVTEAEIAKIKAENETITTDLAAVQKMVDGGTHPMSIEVNTKDDEGNITATNYKGIPYAYDGTEPLTLMVRDWTGTAGRGEPIKLTGTKKWTAETTVNGTTIPANTSYVYDSQDMFTLYGLGTYSDTLYQDSYNKMIKSVAANGGFYVGRYEISSGTYTDEQGNTITYTQSQKNQTALEKITWYEMYKYEENYTKYNTGLGVTSEMIWGSQWDQIMIFVNGKNDGNNTKFYVTTPGSRNSGDATVKTGENTVDQVANIFDLEAGRYEWTQEFSSVNTRSARGGKYRVSPYFKNCASYGLGIVPASSGSDVSSRASLYIK